MQNLCNDDGWANAFHANDAVGILLALLTHEDHRVKHYAAGAVKNMMSKIGKSGDLKEISAEAQEAKAAKEAREELRAWAGQRLKELQDEIEGLRNEEERWYPRDLSREIQRYPSKIVFLLLRQHLLEQLVCIQNNYQILY